jgi:hypothetical protein
MVKSSGKNQNQSHGKALRIIGKRQLKDGQKEGRGNDGNESKDHRKDANMYSMECRTGEESGC